MLGLAAEASGWQVAIVPPQLPLPFVTFADDTDALDPEARDAVQTSAWAAKRWNLRSLEVPGLPAIPADRPDLAHRRALAIAAIVRGEGVETVSAPYAGRRFSLRAPARR